MDGLPLVTARQAAAAAKQIRYLSERPCSICGNAVRYVQNASCVPCSNRAAVRHNRLKRRRNRPIGHRRPHVWSKACSRIVNALRTAGGGIVTHEELVAAIWPDEERNDGGPLYARAIITLRVRHLRELGYPIETHHCRGYSYRWTTWTAFPDLGY